MVCEVVDSGDVVVFGFMGVGCDGFVVWCRCWFWCVCVG